MIGPEEIKKLALNWWKPLLQSTLSQKVFFPKSLDRIGKIKSSQITQQFLTIKQEIAKLHLHSKSTTGVGYQVKTIEKKFQRTGTQELPDSIYFETLEDYIDFTGKKKEWKFFLINSEKLLKNIPELREWILTNCEWLTDEQINWEDILKVCRYFLICPRPNLYLRQLPIAVHTKFIEDHTVLLQSLLDFLIPNHIRNHQQKRFSERYFLKYDEPLIRVRLLDKNLNLFGNFSDISLSLSDFEKFDIPAMNVLIAENKMNFLTLPALSSTLAIWSGGGFNVSYLRNIKFLAQKRILYWGDIDEHGFQILHQLRSYYPDAQSMMMDFDTFEKFSEFVVQGARNNSLQLSLLKDEERKLFEYLKLTDKNRLEQEKISQEYAEEYFNSLLSD